MILNRDFRENDIPDRSVNLVLTDTPYEIGKNAYAWLDSDDLQHF